MSSEMTPRRRSTSPPVAPVSASFPASASFPDSDDLLREILLRLPRGPSSLLRASVVCKRWRRIVTDPLFHASFRAHHRNPPILGVFKDSLDEYIVFSSILDPPDRIPPERFALPREYDYELGVLLDCRHGRVLVMDRRHNLFIVCDPITGEHCCLTAPPGFGRYYVNGAVLCADDDQGHVHGGCHSSPFKVVLVLASTYTAQYRPTARVYSSRTGEWGNLISTPVPCGQRDIRASSTLAGNVLYWLLSEDGILEFDLARQTLAVIKGPPMTNDTTDHCIRLIIQAEDGGVGLAVLSYPSLETWQRNVDCHGVVTWVLQNTVEIHDILGLPPKFEEGMGRPMMRYAEDANVVFLHVDSSLFMVQLESMQARRLCESNRYTIYHQFSSFYTPGTAIAGGYDEADIIHDT